MCTAVLLCSSFVSQGQLSGHLESRFSPVKQTERYAAGASLEYLFYYSCRFLPGVSAGAMFEYDAKEFDHVYEFPVQLTARRYLVGSHSCSGGLYMNASLGVSFRKPFTNTQEEEPFQKVMPNGSVGLGIRTPMSYDINVRLGYLADRPYLGVRLGYTF